MIDTMAAPKPSPDDAERWLETARRGESRGFDELYNWLAGPVTGFARARGAHDPEGITNETFLRAFRSLHRFSGGRDQFRSYVFAIARNLLIDADRARRRRPTEVQVAPPETLVPAAEVVALDRAGDDVAPILAHLTKDQRDVIALRIVADMSLDETAKILGRPVTAVKRLQARGLRRLQKEILGKGVST